uniref:Uncharacterized protein n=1 Tax=Arion vulgaris TaxID=1028688 RepID=A0A0B6Y971_9EUPU
MNLCKINNHTCKKRQKDLSQGSKNNTVNTNKTHTQLCTKSLQIILQLRNGWGMSLETKLTSFF